MGQRVLIAALAVTSLALAIFTFNLRSDLTKEATRASDLEHALERARSSNQVALQNANQAWGKVSELKAALKHTKEAGAKANSEAEKKIYALEVRFEEARAATAAALATAMKEAQEKVFELKAELDKSNIDRSKALVAAAAAVSAKAAAETTTKQTEKKVLALEAALKKTEPLRKSSKEDADQERSALARLKTVAGQGGEASAGIVGSANSAPGKKAPERNAELDRSITDKPKAPDTVRAPITAPRAKLESAVLPVPRPRPHRRPTAKSLPMAQRQ